MQLRRRFLAGELKGTGHTNNKSRKRKAYKQATPAVDSDDEDDAVNGTLLEDEDDESDPQAHKQIQAKPVSLPVLSFCRCGGTVAMSFWIAA